MIREINKDEEKKWDAFVRAHSYGDYTALTSYGKVLSRVYGSSQKFFVYEKGGEWQSILPIVFNKDFFGRKRLVSYTGVLIHQLTTKEEQKEIASLWHEHLVSLAKKDKSFSSGILYQRDYPEKFREFSHINQEVAVLPLKSNWEEIENKFERQVMKAIRKAHEQNVVVKRIFDKQSVLSMFYPLYAKWSHKRHGSPAHGAPYFEALCDELSQEIVLYMAFMDKRPVAALLGFDTGMRLYAAFNPSNMSSHHNRANDILHHTMIKDAHARGVKLFDFGPVRYAGQERYKEKWGTTRISADAWYVGRYPGVQMGTGQGIISRAWRMLPFVLAKRLGPFIRRHLGQ